MDDTWKKILGSLTYGIYVLTTRHNEEINGMVASWVSQISYDPPLVMVAVHPNRYSHGMIQNGGCFALHVLPRHRQDLLNRFKGPDPKAKFSGISWAPGESGCPVIRDCLGYLECSVVHRYDPGNHTLFIGQVMNGRLLSEDDPLTTLDYQGTYIGKD